MMGAGAPRWTDVLISWLLAQRRHRKPPRLEPETMLESRAGFIAMTVPAPSSCAMT